MFYSCTRGVFVRCEFYKRLERRIDRLCLKNSVLKLLVRRTLTLHWYHKYFVVPPSHNQDNFWSLSWVFVLEANTWSISEGFKSIKNDNEHGTRCKCSFEQQFSNVHFYVLMQHLTSFRWGFNKVILRMFSFRYRLSFIVTWISGDTQKVKWVSLICTFF